MVNKAKLKKNAGTEGEEKSPYSPAEIKKFLEEVKVEFSKIVWPDKKVTLGLTGIVILFTVVVATYLGTVDLLLGKLVTYILR